MAFTKSRPRSRVLESILVLVALASVIYHVVAVFATFHGAMAHYTVHLGLILLLVALQNLREKLVFHEGPRRTAWLVFTGIMVASTVLSTVYLYAMAESLELSQPFLTEFQYAIGLLLLIAVLGLNWVVWGTALSVVTLGTALYFGLGDLFPSPVMDMKFSPQVVMSYLAGMGGPRGVYTFIPLSANAIFLLLVYGGLLASTLALDMFAELGKAIGNFLRGGVAYSCITASSLIGMVTGQTVSCIALSGSMTIPTMHRGGFTREQAGAIEVMAANGSQIIPPVMGLGAFLMAVLLGISYVEVAAAAVVPAFLYMLTLALGVYAMVESSPQIPFDREKVDWLLFLWVLPSFLISISLIIVMLSFRYSASLAAVWGIVAITGLSILRPRKFRPSLKNMVLGFRDGAIAGAQLAVILAAIGIIVQMLVTTGLGTLFGRLMIEASGNSREIALVFGMAIAVIIGMGLPTPAAYSLAAIVMIPSLIDVGVNPLAAHFYGFYFAVFSSFTPPVAVGVFMAVRISRGSFRGTCIEAFKLGAIGMLLPFFLVYFPNSLQFPNLTLETMVAIGLLCVSTAMLTATIYGGFMGKLNSAERCYMLLGPILTLLFYRWPHPWLTWLPPFLLVAFIVYRRGKKQAAAWSAKI